MLEKIVWNEEGRALILALIALGVGMVILPTFLAQINANLFASRTIEVGIKEYYASDAAIEYTLWQIKCNTEEFLEDLEVGETKPLTVVVGGSAVSVSIAQLTSASGSNEVDAVLVMDISGSMADYDGDNRCGPYGDCFGGPDEDDWFDDDWQPIGHAKEAATAFVDILEQYSVGVRHDVGLVTYATSVKRVQPLPSNWTAVRNAISHISVANPCTGEGYTDIGDAISAAADELQQHGRENTVKVIVLLSDGKTNVCPGCSNPTYCEETCTQYAKEQADEACAGTDGGINFFTIALGTEVDTDLMEYIARYDQSKPDGCEPRNGVDPGQTPDFYQESSSSDELKAKFEAIAFYLASPQYNIIATTGDTAIESRVQHSEEYDRVGIFTWFTR
jgi:Mg-chelatase subunit ChlD